MSDEGELVANRYRITGRIGTGAMGAVWQGRDELLGRTVAIKQLLLQPGLDELEAEEARQRTMREGRIAARLHHPNAITVFDAVTDENGQPCLIMEYLESTSLAAMLQERSTLPPVEVAGIGQQVASALKSAHQVGIVHRDIKPGNVLLTEDGLVKITDFGISRATDDVSITKTGLIAGTPAYLAPEVALGNDPGPASDLFSLGSTLYAATEGEPPFGLSENTLGLLHAVAAGQINPPRQSGPLTSVLALLLHPEQEQRPDAARAEELLAAVARGETPVGGPVDTPTGGTTVVAASGAAGTGAGSPDSPDSSETTVVAPTEAPNATRIAPAAAAEGDPAEDAGEDHHRHRRRWVPIASGGLVTAFIVAFLYWIIATPTQTHGETPAPPPPETTSPEETTTDRTTTTTTPKELHQPTRTGSDRTGDQEPERTTTEGTAEHDSPTPRTTDEDADGDSGDEGDSDRGGNGGSDDDENGSGDGDGDNGGGGDNGDNGDNGDDDDDDNGGDGGNGGDGNGDQGASTASGT
ncbi:serine/threonine-protein kinase [Haloechinothrix sp. LS1_15]|uniref:serine/threonine-protein kinase n=1 Tax=Haloechinothrix sp. LS1_15 TaxID=2652248 RepID=UPI0029478432|nr:serine/threonine-protein kinase [Haloechinothrix sp. LS1_15]MDV6013041.1 serine/threonine protein kinase [Haloechinothrix sp. LS1_15]